MRKHTCTHAPNTVQMCSLEEILFSGLVLSQSSGKQARALGAWGSFREESCQRSLHSPCESDLCYEQSVTANKTSTFNNPSSQVLFLHIFQSVCTVQNHTTQVNKTRKVKGPSQTGQAHAATSNPKHHPRMDAEKTGRATWRPERHRFSEHFATLGSPPWVSSHPVFLSKLRPKSLGGSTIPHH